MAKGPRIQPDFRAFRSFVSENVGFDKAGKEACGVSVVRTRTCSSSMSNVAVYSSSRRASTTSQTSSLSPKDLKQLWVEYETYVSSREIHELLDFLFELSAFENSARSAGVANSDQLFGKSDWQLHGYPDIIGAKNDDALHGYDNYGQYFNQVIQPDSQKAIVDAAKDASWRAETCIDGKRSPAGNPKEQGVGGAFNANHINKSQAQAGEIVTSPRDAQLDLTIRAKSLLARYIEAGAPLELNISARLRRETILRVADGVVLPAAFKEIKQEAMSALYLNSWRAFLHDRRERGKNQE